MRYRTPAPNSGAQRKKAPTFIVRVYDSETGSLLLAESDLMFNAQPVEVVDLLVTRTFSECERHLATIDPVRENVSVADLTAKDIGFLSGETGIETQHLEFLTIAARLAKQTELPLECFYGLFRQGQPTTLSDLLDQEPEVLRRALEAALDSNVIPHRLRDNLEAYLERLGQLKETDPNIQRKQQKNRLRRLGKIVNLDDAKIEAVVTKAAYPAMVTDRLLASMVEAGELQDSEAKELGLTVCLFQLCDENDKLAEAIKKGDFPRLPQGKIGRLDDLTVFDKEDWLHILAQAETEPAAGFSPEGYAAFFVKKVENLYPSKAMLARVTAKATDGVANGLETLRPLFESNETLFGGERFSALNIPAVDPDTQERLRQTHSRLKALANTYPGLRIADILDDRQLSATAKEEQMTARIGLLTRFHAQNSDTEFLFLDYSPDSADLQALDFAGFSTDEQRMVLKTVKAYQRMYSVTRDATHTKVLLQQGHLSPLSIVNLSRKEFVESLGEDTTVSDTYYRNACNVATHMGVSAFTMMESGNAYAQWASVDNSDYHSLSEYLKKIDGWETLFGNLDYCKCEHCRSIFSPAAYFVDLLRFLEKNVYFTGRGGGEDVAWETSAGFRAREDHPLHLRKRRPDLWQLPLTCENTIQLIPYLDIINEVLENYIALETGIADGLHDPRLAPEAENRWELVNGVYRRLYDSVRSFTQPFSLPLERLAVYLAHFGVTREEITRLLDEPRDVIAGAALTLSKKAMPSDVRKREFELITEPNTELEHLRSLYGLHFESDPRTGELVFYDSTLQSTDFASIEEFHEWREKSKNDVQMLLTAMGLTRAELGHLITTEFVRTEYHMVVVGSGETVEIRSEKRVPEGDDASVQNDIERIHGLSALALERMHRFTRLWRHVPWSIKELDLVLHKLAGPGATNGSTAATLQNVADILSAQRRFDLSVEELGALWGALPDDPVAEGKESLFDRLFNLPDFVRLNGTFPKAEPFLHPAFRETIPPEVDYPLHRLLAGLRVDNEKLHLLITNLIRPLRGLGPDSPEPHDKSFLLSQHNLSLLYRHARLAEALRLLIPQLFQLIRLAPAITTDHIAGLPDLSALIDFYDWWKSTDYTLDDLAFITAGPVAKPEPYPDAEALTAKLLRQARTNQALTFTHTAFAFLEGVTEEQSQDIISANPDCFDKASGTRYRAAERLSDTSEIVIPDMPLGEAPIAVGPIAVQNLLLTYRTDSMPVFDDTLFTAISGVTADQSRAIVAANPAWIIPAPLENAYWLTPSFPAETLIIPPNIPIIQTAARGLLSTYHATDIIPNYLASELGLPAEKINALITLAGIDLTDPIYTEALKGEAPNERIRDLITTLLPLTILFEHKAFDRSTLDFVQEDRDRFAIADITAIGMGSLRLVSIFLDFLKKFDGRELERQILFDVLVSFIPHHSKFYVSTTADKQLIQHKLAQVLNAEVGLAITTHDEITLAGTALEALAKLDRCLALAKRLGVGGDVLKLIVSNEFDTLNMAANAVLSAFRAKYKSEDEWQEKIQPFEDKIRSRKRDALSDYLIHSLDPQPFSTLHDLYHHFLVDVELEGCARTSRVVAANSSLQLYMHRILIDLEQDRAGALKACIDEDAVEEWKWRKNYRVWEANRKIFLYPENYIEPDLRDNKTPLFEELESTLLQQEINEETVLEAYATYMRSFDELANLRIAGSYHDKGDDADFLHLFGVTSSEPPVFYYRVVENAYRSEKEPETHKIAWHPWRKIEVQIPVRKVSPIVFKRRLYVFWMEITTQPDSTVRAGNSDFNGYKHTISFKFTTLRLDGSWTPPQKVFPLGPPTGPVNVSNWNGVVKDQLSSDIPRYDKDRRQHLESEAGYTLEGFAWDRVYPENDSDLQLLVTAAGFRIWDRVDVENKRIVTQQPLPRRQEYNKSKVLGCMTNSYRMLYYGSLGGIGPTGTVSTGDYAFCSLVLDDSRIAEFLELYKDEIIGFDWLYPSSTLFVPDQHIAVLNPHDELSLINGSLNDCIIDSEGDLLLVQGSVRDGERFLIRRIGTTLSARMVNRLFSRGVDGLLETQYQETSLREARMPIFPREAVVDYSSMTKLNYEGPYGVYYREIFFHIPFLIANHLNSQSKFAEAQTWYHYIFDPTARETGRETHPEDRNWRYREFREKDIESMRQALGSSEAIAAYKKDPFNPHAIARLRFGAYQKAIVMKYIDNLLDWGDHLFAQDTMESINEATLLYVLASDILGERPAELGECGEATARNYAEISPVLDKQDNDFLIEMYHVINRGSSHSGTFSYNYVANSSWLYSATKNATDHVSTRCYKIAGQGMAGGGLWTSEESVSIHITTERMAIAPSEDVLTRKEGLFRGTQWIDFKKQENNAKYVYGFVVPFAYELGPVFCIPPNKDLLGYWDRVEDRLFKIRHCMNLSGVRRELVLFAPEISPMLLVRAKAAGLSLEDVLNSLSGDLPPYRFSYLIERAKGYAAMLQGFGAALLSALEKKDLEDLNQIRTSHQQFILRQTRQVRQWEIEVAGEAYEALQKRKAAVEYRRNYYQGLIDEGLIAQEETQQNARNTAKGFEEASEIMHLMGALGFFIPQLGSPFAITFGGIQIGSYGEAFGQLLRSSAAIANTLSASAGLEASFRRREEGWQHQSDLADYELNELEKQIRVAEIRLEIANRSLEIHDKTSEQLDEVYEFYRDKFSNLGLYTWLSTNLQNLFKETYNNAYAMAKLAERAYRFERGDDAAELIGPNHWEASRAGLLAGERLLLDLQNLERRFIETNYRNLEIDQSFSLTQIAPAALILLKETGECNFDIPEIFFDLFYPGHYKRKIRSARLTIPCITGPYTNVSATLELKDSWIRTEPKLDANLRQVPRSRTVAITTSTAQNDAGVFELNFRDERYMPFEGAGAVSSWQLSLPKNFRQFDYQTINDVLLHISYTAEQDNAFRAAVEDQNGVVEGTIRQFLTTESLSRVFSLRQEFSSEFNRLLYSPAGTNVRITISDKHFPIFLKGYDLRIVEAMLVLDTPKGQSVEGFSMSIDRPTPDEPIEFGRSGVQWGGLPFSDLSGIFVENMIGGHIITIQNGGALSPDPLLPPDVSAIDSNHLSDIYLFLRYGI